MTTHDGDFVLVRWSAYDEPMAPAPTFLSLDRARSIDDAARALATVPGPTTNSHRRRERPRGLCDGGRDFQRPVWRAGFIQLPILANRIRIFPASCLPRVAPSLDGISGPPTTRCTGTYPLS